MNHRRCCGLTASTVWRLILCVAFCLTHGVDDPHCGVHIPRAPGAPDDSYHDIGRGNPDGLDLEDQLFSGLEQQQYKRLRNACAHGDGASCRTFGIQQWNLTYDTVLEAESIKGRPCDEDWEIWPVMCGRGAMCKEIGGKKRIVGIRSAMNRAKMHAWARLPYLFALDLSHVDDKSDYWGAALPTGLQVIKVQLKTVHTWTTLTPLMRAQGNIRSVFVLGNQNLKHWIKVDLSELCGLELLRFTAFVINTAGGAIPQCWSSMTNLQAFYCTNCMMTEPPTAFAGFKALTSFIAFRQSEMVPCALHDLAQDVKKCKPSWETKHAFKEGGLRNSTGRWDDFQEGPSFLCPESSYAFAFAEFLKLGWTNIQKVWLDGNFLTGGIPEEIAEVWPSLQSLDLYGNDMEGPIPESLGKLDFVKLQLQENRFSGEVPQNVFSLLKKRHIALGLSGNPELRGCHKRAIGGTQIRPCAGKGQLEL